MSDATLSHDPAPASDEDLPPHRAAIPVPPAILLEDKLTRRRKSVSIAVVFSLALHAGFLSAAALWGQGQPLPDADIFTAAIRVQIAEVHTGETIIPKGAEAVAPPLAPIVIDTEPLRDAISSPPPQDVAAQRSNASTAETAEAHSLAPPADAVAPKPAPASVVAEPTAPPPVTTVDAAPALPAMPEPSGADAVSARAFSSHDAHVASPRDIIAEDAPSDAPAAQPMPPAQDIPPQNIAASEQTAPPDDASGTAQVNPSQDVSAAEKTSAQHDAPAANKPASADPAAVPASEAPPSAEIAAANPDPAGRAEQSAAPAGEPGEERGEGATSHLAAAMAVVQETPRAGVDASPQAEAGAPTLRRPEERLAALLDLGSAADDGPATGATKQDRAIPAEDGYKPPQMRGSKRANVNAPGVQHDGSSRLQAKSATRRVSLFGYKRRIRARVMRALPVGVWGPGRVVVGFRLSRSGGLLAATVLRSSGNPFMDQAALACVRNAGPYPRPPAGSTSDQLALSIDFRFQ
jgi:protein TonB